MRPVNLKRAKVPSRSFETWRATAARTGTTKMTGASSLRRRRPARIITPRDGNQGHARHDEAAHPDREGIVEFRATRKPHPAGREGNLPSMLFMVIERFKQGIQAVGERFRHSGRMLPEGVVCHASWVDSAGGRCFQVMEALRPESLNAWTSRWDDLIDFEIIPVQASTEFWSQIERSGE